MKKKTGKYTELWNLLKKYVGKSYARGSEKKK